MSGSWQVGGCHVGVLEGCLEVLGCFGNLAVLKNIFDFILGPPSHGGVPGQGPDCHFPKEIRGVRTDSGLDPGGNLF